MDTSSAPSGRTAVRPYGGTRVARRAHARPGRHDVAQFGPKRAPLRRNPGGPASRVDATWLDIDRLFPIPFRVPIARQ